MNSSAKLHHVKYGTTTIDFTLQYSARNTLGIKVNPDLTVSVAAPVNSSIEEIQTKIENKGRWIVKQWEFFESFLPRTPRREYVSGETHNYIGKQYRLKITKARKQEVKLKGRYLHLSIPNPNDRVRIKLLLAKWYRDHALDIFDWRIEQNLGKFKKYKLSFPKLVVRRMEKRWGSCTAEGKVTLNPEIIKAPVKCIDYVIVHELCHLIHHNHSSDFYKLQNKMMPDCEKWKMKLEQFLS